MRLTGRGRPRRRGFNLLEISIASILFATIVVFITSIWGMHARVIGKSRSRMVATFLAEQLLEECINDGYVAVDQRAGSDELEMITWMRGREIRVNYKYTLTVEKHPDFPKTLKIIKVSVEFPGEDPEDSPYREVKYETMLAKSS